MDYVEVIEGSHPIILELPHSGRIGLDGPEDVPPVIAERVRYDSEEVRRTLGFGCDVAVPEITGLRDLIEDYDITVVRNRLARVYTDPNRALQNIHPWAYEGASAGGPLHGLIWASTVPHKMNLALGREQIEAEARKRFEPVLDRPLSEEEWKALLKEVYHPYHTALRQQHLRLRGNHDHVVHLALHTMPPTTVTMVDGAYVVGGKAKKGPVNLQEGSFPDLLVIHNAFQAADPAYIQVVKDSFGDALVQDGEGPFQGNTGVTALYGKPAEGIHVIGLEHVPHGIETMRHTGGTAVNHTEAAKWAPAYRQVIENLLETMGA